MAYARAVPESPPCPHAEVFVEHVEHCAHIGEYLRTTIALRCARCGVAQPFAVENPTADLMERAAAHLNRRDILSIKVLLHG